MQDIEAHQLRRGLPRQWGQEGKQVGLQDLLGCGVALLHLCTIWQPLRCPAKSNKACVIVLLPYLLQVALMRLIVM